MVINGLTFWAYLDTGSGRNFISKEAVRKLKLSPMRHDSRHVVTINGSKKHSMPVYQVDIVSVDNDARENIEITGTKLSDFTSVKQPAIRELKSLYQHASGKTFCHTANDEYPIHIILGDATYCKIRTEEIFKGRPEDTIVEGTNFGWVIHSGEQYTDGRCMFTRDSNEYERLYSLDVLGVDDRGKDDQSHVYREFQEDIVVQEDGRYEVSVPWIPGVELGKTNEEPSRKSLRNVERKLNREPVLKDAYEAIVQDQLEKGIIKPVPAKPTGPRVFYMPYKPVIRDPATSSTPVRMVFDASAQPTPLDNSVNQCMYSSPPLQPLLYDIMIRARMSTNLLLADLKKNFLQNGIIENDRDAFRFIFNINDQEKHFRFTRVLFGAEASPFMLGATLRYHYNRQPTEFGTTVEALKRDTYVDNLMKTGDTIEELQTFKEEAIKVFEQARFPVHKWESNIKTLECKDMPNPTKILGHLWDKSEDSLEITVPPPLDPEIPITKSAILSKLASVYDPLGIISPTIVQGKHIYREACDEKSD